MCQNLGTGGSSRTVLTIVQRQAVQCAAHFVLTCLREANFRNEQPSWRVARSIFCAAAPRSACGSLWLREATTWSLFSVSKMWRFSWDKRRVTGCKNAESQISEIVEPQRGTTGGIRRVCGLSEGQPYTRSWCGRGLPKASSTITTWPSCRFRHLAIWCWVPLVVVVG